MTPTLTVPWPPADGRLVVVGTDTDVGKTVVSALLVQGLNASYWKPVQCGDLAVGGDSGRVAGLTGLNRSSQHPLPAARGLSPGRASFPNQAARDEGIGVDDSGSLCLAWRPSGSGNGRGIVGAPAG